LKNDATRTYLMKIAEAVERWPRMPKDSAEVAIAVATPAGAMRYTASTILDVGETCGRPGGTPSDSQG
jgi:hypothetical protein